MFLIHLAKINYQALLLMAQINYQALLMILLRNHNHYNKNQYLIISNRGKQIIINQKKKENFVKWWSKRSAYSWMEMAVLNSIFVLIKPAIRLVVVNADKVLVTSAKLWNAISQGSNARIIIFVKKKDAFLVVTFTR